MITLKPGDRLRIVRRAAGLGLESLDVSIINEGTIVRYLSPTWMLVRLPDGEEVEIHVSALEIMKEE